MFKSILLAVVLGAATCHGADFTVTTDTSSLLGEPSGPFSLDFQFIDGSGLGDANNTVTLSGFNFNGGGWTGAPNITGGGSLALGAITLTDRAFFNEVFQGFTPGGSLSFNVSLTTAVDAGGIPDQFSFAILNNSLIEIPTLGLGDAFVNVDIDSAIPAVPSFGSDSSRTAINIPAPIITIAAVPDSAVPTMLAGALWGMVLGLRRKLLPASRHRA